MPIVLGVGIAAALLLGWLANSRWLARHGWVYNRHNPRPPGAGGTLGLLESIYQPSVEHVIEERASERAAGSQDESGEKP